jgi:hypothetical protein
VGDALAGFAFSAQRDECFALEIEDVLLAHDLRRGERAACQNIRELASANGMSPFPVISPNPY